MDYRMRRALILPGLQKTNGSIVATSPVTGIISPTKLATFSAQKHALHGFFGGLRQDLALQGHKGISVTLSVLPLIDTKNSHKESQTPSHWEKYSSVGKR